MEDHLGEPWNARTHMGMETFCVTSNVSLFVILKLYTRKGK